MNKELWVEIKKYVIPPMVFSLITFGGAGGISDLIQRNSMSGEAWIAVLVALPVMAGLIGLIRVCLLPAKEMK